MRLIVFGLGYTGRAILAAARANGWDAVGVSRTPGAPDEIGFAEAGSALATATHLVATAPPDDGGDPVLARYGGALHHLTWAGYLSSTGVYGDRGGGWVDETSEPRPSSGRARRRLDAEQAWRAAGLPALDILRLAGIYGPGRSALDDVRAGRARRVDAPGHAFGRIHRDDIARLVLAAAERPAAGCRVLNGNDDEPAPSADVTAEAARLLGAPLPPLVPFADALAAMSPMGRSFWADNRRVSAARTKAALGLDWRYPTFREGLRAILEQEGDGPAQQVEIGGA